MKTIIPEANTMTTPISPRATIMPPPSAPLGRARAKRVVKPAMPEPRALQDEPGCFAQAFNSVFEAVMTKLFGRDGRG